MAKITLNSVKNVTKKVASATIKELPKEKRQGITDKMIPYRTTGLGNLAILTGVTAYSGAKLGVDANASVKAKTLGEFEAHGLANQVGRTPLQHHDEFIKGVPTRARQTAIGSILNSPTEGYYVQPYDDLGAGGDLVFALNNLR